MNQYVGEFSNEAGPTMVADSKGEGTSMVGDTERRTSKPLLRRAMQWIRRGHLYCGLFLLPWALLYGVTGLLFNHPTFFSETPIVYLSQEDLNEAGLGEFEQLDAFCTRVVEQLNSRNTTGSPWKLGSSQARFTGRDTLVITVKSSEKSFFLVVDPLSRTGLIREIVKRRVNPVTAPFDTNSLTSANPQVERPNPVPIPKSGGELEIASIVDRLRDIAPTLMQHKGLPGGEAAITSAPDIEFPVIVGGREWIATFNPITKHVTGIEGGAQPEMSLRTFLLRMHLSHHYPGVFNVKWIWAIGVDSIALTLCFWGISGLMMWWQIKATRRIGTVVLLASVVTASVLALNMHATLSGS
jgi:hypothetical protein